MQKIKVFITIAAFLLSVAVTGQDLRHSLSFGGGYSLPIGKFASKTFDDPKAGMAGSGYFGQVNLERHFSRRFGIRFSANHNINTTNTEPVVEHANYLVDMYRYLIGEEGTYTWTAEAHEWKQTSLMLGPVLYIPAGPIDLEMHAQFGRLFITSPRVSLEGTSSTGTNPISALMTPIKTQTWGVAGGAGIRIPLGRVVQFKLFGQAIAADATFKDIGLKGIINGLEVTQEISERRAVAIINTGAALVFKF